MSVVIFSKKKWKRFVQQVKLGKVQGIFDFDGTITEIAEIIWQGGKIILRSHWEALETVLPEKTRQKLIVLNKRNVINSHSSTLSLEQQFLWVYIPFALFKQHQLTQSMLIETVKLIKPRQGMKDLFNLLGTENILIISYGIADWIQFFLIEYNLGFEIEVIATEFIFKKEQLIDIKPKTIVLPINKGIFMQKKCQPEKFTVVVGDTTGDEELFGNNQEGINIFILHSSSQFSSPRKVKNKIPEIDVVIIGESYEPLLQKIDSALGRYS